MKLKCLRIFGALVILLVMVAAAMSVTPTSAQDGDTVTITSDASCWAPIQKDSPDVSSVPNCKIPAGTVLKGFTYPFNPSYWQVYSDVNNDGTVEQVLVTSNAVGKDVNPNGTAGPGDQNGNGVVQGKSIVNHEAIWEAILPTNKDALLWNARILAVFGFVAIGVYGLWEQMKEHRSMIVFGMLIGIGVYAVFITIESQLVPVCPSNVGMCPVSKENALGMLFGGLATFLVVIGIPILIAACWTRNRTIDLPDEIDIERGKGHEKDEAKKSYPNYKPEELRTAWVGKQAGTFQHVKVTRVIPLGIELTPTYITLAALTAVTIFLSSFGVKTFLYFNLDWVPTFTPPNLAGQASNFWNPWLLGCIVATVETCREFGMRKAVRLFGGWIIWLLIAGRVPWLPFYLVSLAYIFYSWFTQMGDRKFNQGPSDFFGAMVMWIIYIAVGQGGYEILGNGINLAIDKFFQENTPQFINDFWHFTKPDQLPQAFQQFIAPAFAVLHPFISGVKKTASLVVTFIG
jgi:hypothetical protein